MKKLFSRTVIEMKNNEHPIQLYKDVSFTFINSMMNKVIFKPTKNFKTKETRNSIKTNGPISITYKNFAEKAKS